MCKATNTKCGNNNLKDFSLFVEMFGVLGQAEVVYHCRFFTFSNFSGLSPSGRPAGRRPAVVGALGGRQKGTGFPIEYLHKVKSGGGSA